MPSWAAQGLDNSKSSELLARSIASSAARRRIQFFKGRGIIVDRRSTRTQDREREDHRSGARRSGVSFELRRARRTDKIQEGTANECRVDDARIGAAWRDIGRRRSRLQTLIADAKTSCETADGVFEIERSRPARSRCRAVANVKARRFRRGDRSQRSQGRAGGSNHATSRRRGASLESRGQTCRCNALSDK